MATILPECLEVQFGWVQRQSYRAGVIITKHLTQATPGAHGFRIRHIQTGCVEFSVGGQQARFDRGAVALIPPVVQPDIHGMRFLQSTAFISVGFRLLLFGSIDITPRLLNRMEYWQPEPRDVTALDGLMQLLLDRAHPPTIAASLLREGLMRALLGLIWDQLHADDLIEGLRPSIPRWLLYVMQEIRHAPGMSVTQLERLSGFSHAHFNRLFHHHIGVTPREYLQQYRMDIAKRLLTTTDISIAAIGEHVGFANASDFTRFFHHHCQMTPTDYRTLTFLNVSKGEA